MNSEIFCFKYARTSSDIVDTIKRTIKYRKKVYELINRIYSWDPSNFTVYNKNEYITKMSNNILNQEELEELIKLSDAEIKQFCPLSKLELKIKLDNIFGINLNMSEIRNSDFLEIEVANQKKFEEDSNIQIYDDQPDENNKFVQINLDDVEETKAKIYNNHLSLMEIEEDIENEILNIYEEELEEKLVIDKEQDVKNGIIYLSEIEEEINLEAEIASNNEEESKKGETEGALIGGKKLLKNNYSLLELINVKIGSNKTTNFDIKVIEKKFKRGICNREYKFWCV